MSTKIQKPSSSISHAERTIHEPRDVNLHRTAITSISHPNPQIRILQLTPSTNVPIHFKPGQWLDIHIPSLPKPGGFTITSPPSKPYLELAIQKSIKNPAAEWLWKDEKDVLGSEVQVRVGGGFVWPPPCVGEGGKRGNGVIKRVVFIAGGVGVNPLVSIVSYLEGLKEEVGALGFQVVFLYSSKVIKEGEGEVLFLERLRRSFERLGGEGLLRVFLTGNGSEEVDERAEKRRIAEGDLMEALGEEGERGETVVYVCGVPSMTDEVVERIRRVEGIREGNVLCERWW